MIPHGGDRRFAAVIFLIVCTVFNPRDSAFGDDAGEPVVSDANEIVELIGRIETNLESNPLILRERIRNILQDLDAQYNYGVVCDDDLMERALKLCHDSLSSLKDSLDSGLTPVNDAALPVGLITISNRVRDSHGKFENGLPENLDVVAYAGKSRQEWSTFLTQELFGVSRQLISLRHQRVSAAIGRMSELLNAEIVSEESLEEHQIELSALQLERAASFVIRADENEGRTTDWFAPELVVLGSESRELHERVGHLSVSFGFADDLMALLGVINGASIGIGFTQSHAEVIQHDFNELRRQVNELLEETSDLIGVEIDCLFGSKTFPWSREMEFRDCAQGIAKLRSAVIDAGFRIHPYERISIGSVLDYSNSEGRLNVDWRDSVRRLDSVLRYPPLRPEKIFP